MDADKFREWINARYSEWRGGNNNRAGSVTAYARWIGVSSTLMGYYINGRDGHSMAPASPFVLEKFSRRYPNIYEVLGLPDPYGKLPVDVRVRLRRVLVEIEAISGPVDEATLREILERELFDVDNSTKDSSG
jgi:hypothetical protein